MNQLAEVEIIALSEALDDEYRVWPPRDTLLQCVAHFTQTPHISNIRESKGQHTRALQSLPKIMAYRRSVERDNGHGHEWMRR